MVGGQGDPVGLWLLRPLLSCTREEVLAFLMESGVETVADPSNQDPRYLRSRLRHQVLPLLRREHPTIERRLGELAESLRLDAELLEEQAVLEICISKAVLIVHPVSLLLVKKVNGVCYGWSLKFWRM